MNGLHLLGIDLRRLCKHVVLIVLVASAGGCSKSDSDDSSSTRNGEDRDSQEETFPDFQEPDIIQSAISFYGWIGDTAVLAEEVYTENNESYAEFYLLRPGEGEMRLLEMGDSLVRMPGVVAGGIDVAPLHGMNPKEPFLELYLSYDTVALSAIEADLDKIEMENDLPEPVGGVLGIVWHRPEISADTLWLDSVFVGPYYGEAKVEYHLPEVTYSELSQSRRSLMVALWLNDYIEYFVFDLTQIGR